MINYEGKQIIVVDGADGVGKSTQIQLLKNKYPDKNFNKFPNYNSVMGHLITNYLNNNMNDILNDEDDFMTGIKRASMLYTMDRLYWFNTKYDNKKDLICDRYTTSNMIHMGANILNEGGNMDDVEEYIDILYYLEYIQLGIPKPTTTIYLDADIEVIWNNLISRGETLDKHESRTLLEHIETVKKYLFDKYNWNVIKCTNDGKLRSIEDINNELCKIINKDILIY